MEFCRDVTVFDFFEQPLLKSLDFCGKMWYHKQKTSGTTGAKVEEYQMNTTCMSYPPAVCAVRQTYQILVPVHTPTVLWVRVGKKIYYDDSNGILRSDTVLHRVSVPASVLDAAGEYTVCWREVVERRPYFSKMKEEQSETFSFCPVRSDPIRAYMIADAHGKFDETVGAAKKFAEVYGGIDLLILNGDILDHSGDAENFMLYYRIAGEITGGAVPVVISRGNHDLRGKCAEQLASYMPNENGNSFYSFRLGNLWGILLDCGEDKDDGHPEYNGTVCCHAFRERETAYLKAIIRNAKKEYNAPGVEHRIVISHVPFTQIDRDPFNIEQKIYGEWVRMLNEKIHPELLLSGHVHLAYITRPGDARDSYGMTFPTVVGSEVRSKESYFAGCGIVWDEGRVRVVLNDRDGIRQECDPREKK